MVRIILAWHPRPYYAFCIDLSETILNLSDRPVPVLEDD